MADKIACFIDGGHLDKVLKKAFGGAKIDYEKLALWMAGSDLLFRTYYYHCLPHQSNPPTPDEARRYSQALKFIRRLEQFNRFEVRLGKLEKIGETYRQKQVDVLFAIDLVNLSTKRVINCAGILTSDSDFLPAIKRAKDEGIIVKLFYCDHPDLRPHHELWQISDERFQITSEVITSILRK